MEATTKTVTANKRLVSLDVMRGVIMVLLAAESTRVYEVMADFKLGGAGGMIVNQFFHHEWNGLTFWDLVQPAFMLMAGSAMYISYYYKTQKGITWQQNLPHIAWRCFKLFLFGVGLHCVYNGKLVWELWNVLTQLAFTTMIAYFIIRWSYTSQIIFSFGLLILAEVLYRYTNIPGYDQPFVIDRNFGSFMDMVTMGKINNGGGWVFINIITTAAHTIWGVLAGKLLISKNSNAYKITALLIAGVIGLVLGYGLDFAGITPVIKRIATSSFTLASGGWVLLIMAFLYWLTDIKKWNKNAWIFTVVGMNPIFIYIVFQIMSGWLNSTVNIFVGGFSGLLGAGENWQALFTSLGSLFVLWYICYWLYKKKIFFKL